MVVVIFSGFGSGRQHAGSRPAGGAACETAFEYIDRTSARGEPPADGEPCHPSADNPNFHGAIFMTAS
jgi:hypothetical protein